MKSGTWTGYKWWSLTEEHRATGCPGHSTTKWQVDPLHPTRQVCTCTVCGFAVAIVAPVVLVVEQPPEHGAAG